jgi:pyruvate,water dikinase
MLAYCNSKGINPDDIKVAVVIQKIVNSESAGVCFTANPITGNREEVMIEA